jgi:hypothetical protein
MIRVTPFARDAVIHWSRTVYSANANIVGTSATARAAGRAPEKYDWNSVKKN